MRPGVAARLRLEQVDGHLARLAVARQLLGPRPYFVVECAVRRTPELPGDLAHRREGGAQPLRRDVPYARVGGRARPPEALDERTQVRRLLAAQDGGGVVPGQRPQGLAGRAVAVRQVVDPAAFQDSCGW